MHISLHLRMLCLSNAMSSPKRWPQACDFLSFFTFPLRGLEGAGHCSDITLGGAGPYHPSTLKCSWEVFNILLIKIAECSTIIYPHWIGQGSLESVKWHWLSYCRVPTLMGFKKFALTYCLAVVHRKIHYTRRSLLNLYERTFSVPHPFNYDFCPCNTAGSPWLFYSQGPQLIQTNIWSLRLFILKLTSLLLMSQDSPESFVARKDFLLLRPPLQSVAMWSLSLSTKPTWLS